MPTLAVWCAFCTSFVKSLLSLVFARFYKPQHVSMRDLTGKTAIVTGANSGIGLSIAVALAKQGAAVCLACRNSDRGAAAIEQVVSQCDNINKGKVTCRIIDIGDLSSVRAFCKAWREEGTKIDILCHNAGIAAPPKGISTKTIDGLNMIYATNFLGSFLMTHLLESCLSSTARVVMTSSTGSYSATAHFLQDNTRKTKAFAPGVLAQVIAKVKAALGLEAENSASAYGISKAQQVIFASLLQRHFNAHAFDNASEKVHRTAHAFTPGFTSTPIFGKFDVTWHTWFTNPLFTILKATEKYVAVDTNEGAKTGAWLATWGDEIGKRRHGGAFWERMEKETSLVEIMDEKRKIAEWEEWETDASILWNI